MTDTNQLSVIAGDIHLCEMILAFGRAADKAKAKRHLKVCKDAMTGILSADPIPEDGMTDEELLAELFA
jgi:hypothetical protein